MPDIAMCEGKGCSVKESCYRFTATPSDYWQSYVMPEVKDGKCELYWPTESSEKLDKRKE